MAQVTGGVVKYGRKIQKAQFEPLEAEVELSFSLDEGEKNFEDALDQYANAVVQKVHTMIGIPVPAKAATASEGLPSSAPAPGPVAAPAALDLSGRIDMGAPQTMAEQPERTKADLVAEKIAEVSDPAALTDGPPKRRGRPPKKETDPASIAPSVDVEADPAAIGITPVEPDPSVSNGSDAAGSAPSDPASLDGDVFTSAQPPVPDGQLQEAIARHNEKTKATQAIRELIFKYAGPPPKSFRDIPVEVRPRFLEELNAIAPAATA